MHPPFTDLTIGAFTVTAVAVIVGWVGFLERRMADVAFVAAVVALISAVPTILTGFVDYLSIPRGTNPRRTAALHWIIMVSATALFLVATALLQPGLNEEGIPLTGGILAVAAWLLLVLGSWVGGALVFAHGIRVERRRDISTREAITPRRPD